MVVPQQHTSAPTRTTYHYYMQCNDSVSGLMPVEFGRNGFSDRGDTNTTKFAAGIRTVPSLSVLALVAAPSAHRSMHHDVRPTATSPTKFQTLGAAKPGQPIFQNSRPGPARPRPIIRSKYLARVGSHFQSIHDMPCLFVFQILASDEMTMFFARTTTTTANHPPQKYFNRHYTTRTTLLACSRQVSGRPLPLCGMSAGLCFRGYLLFEMSAQLNFPEQTVWKACANMLSQANKGRNICTTKFSRTNRVESLRKYVVQGKYGKEYLHSDVFLASTGRQPTVGVQQNVPEALT